ncbi:cell wall-active antibiotics response protein [Halobacteria archaeon AArc-m2/3/4]|uniref:Cell wall-active antibiotics response protein n=1 Tax=Natronoglomus mannanivorans TaxID=2979990 RepID=A0AAP3E451_9EURY|nr:cell wall-active antibiotics response protein [Halobacteria archaeon AArc-xg1-1]MCU4975801.1 cell wall-active antibiotics response protein [Halobacteria archaeon AArc-m2/3/4]
MATTTSSRRLPTSQALLGAIVVLVGILLLLDTTGVVPTRDALLYVPSIFVAVGVWALVQNHFRNIVGPVVLIGVAGAGQLVALEYVTVDQVVVFWPVFVIAFGLSIVLGQFRSHVHDTDDAYTSAFVAFGGIDKRNISKAFTGGDLTAVFGGTELDLRDAVIEDRPARINAVALFGGVDVVVPREWNVQMTVVPVLGGASDDRPRRETQHDEIDLVVTGFAAFGGVSVTD